MVRFVCLALCACLGASCERTVERSIVLRRVVPPMDSACGAPLDARTMVIRSLGDFPASEATAQSIELSGAGEFAVSRFSPGTRVVEILVRGAGGTLATVGRTGVFSLEALTEGSFLGVFMAPPNGACPVGAPHVVRKGPLLSPAIDGVLVAGGTGATGEVVESVEWYEVASASFIEIPADLYGSLLGASMTTLADGRILLAGGISTGFQIFDPKTRTFSVPQFYREVRGYHAAVALEDNRVAFFGGCTRVVGTGCAANSEALTSSIVDPDTGDLEPGPALKQERLGGQAFLEKPGVVVLSGGVDMAGKPITDGERVFFDGRSSERIAGIFGAATQTDDGVVWFGLQGGNGDARGEIGSLSPYMNEPRLYQGLSADKSVQMVSLEDGSVLALGQEYAQLIHTADGSSTRLDLALGGNRQLVRLGDGAVLLFDGQRQQAAVFRPPLVHPWTSSFAVTFEAPRVPPGLTAGDPQSLSWDEPRSLRVQSQDGQFQWLLASGPVFSNLSLQAVVAAKENAEILLIFAWLSPFDHFFVALRGDREPKLVVVADGAERGVGTCAARPVPGDAFTEPGRTTLSLLVDGTQVDVEIGGESILSCTLDEPAHAGKAGLGARGTPDGSVLVDLLAGSRL